MLKKTKLIFVETLGNPSLNIPDFSFLDKTCKQNNIFLVVDSTLTNP